ncbi:uncharacterized protein LOC129917572 [Episyrphus balteatus]|uniref:uncharacterized protein LOC129917572 n=1 Tax=Episyrphus balteatus TaxID=286459 RepID=UPI0024862414|nr:uncharacterized protein LOC129917572 [Episyrphus balteatus]
MRGSRIPDDVCPYDGRVPPLEDAPLTGVDFAIASTNSALYSRFSSSIPAPIMASWYFLDVTISSSNFARRPEAYAGTLRSFGAFFKVENPEDKSIKSKMCKTY